MGVRDLLGVGLVGAAAYGLWRSGVITLPATSLRPPSGPIFGPADDYSQRTSARESGGDPYAKNPRSSASGLFQFTRSTWESLGGQWGSDPTKPFGGLRPSVAEQTARFNQLSQLNAAGLQRAGVGATAGALYAAHFLGLGAAINVLSAAASTPLASVVGSAVMRANPQLTGFTVADFRRWAEGRG